MGARGVTEPLHKIASTLSNLGEFLLAKRRQGSGTAGLKMMIAVGGVWIVFVVVAVSLFVLGAAVHVGLVALVLFVLWIMVVRTGKYDRVRAALNGLPAPLVEAVVAHVGSNPNLETVRGQAHERVLLRAFDDARFCVVVLSGWSPEFMVNRRLMEKIDNALNRGIAVYIGYGLVKNEHWESGASWSAANARGDAGGNGGNGRGRLLIQELSVPANLLVVDDSYAVLGSYNWLSESGFFNMGRSWKITDLALVRAQCVAAVRLFMAPADSDVARM